jgi:uncharacterized protein YndB with AHSA1/START domain
MRLVVERLLPAAPETIWPLITIPDQMNRWSIARIEAVAPGEDGRHDAAGARRRVTVRVLGLSSRLEERIVAAEPPCRFVYRVVAGGGLRDHRGVQTLVAEGPSSARLTWEVTFRAAVPGLAAVLASVLRPRLEASVDALARVLAGSSDP